MSNQKMREKVFDACDRLGFWNVHVVKMAEKLGTAHQNVSRWKKQYIEKYGIPDIEKYGKEMNVNCWSALKELAKMMKNPDPKVKLSAINMLFQCGNRFNEFLGNFRFKDRVATEIITTERPFDLAAAYEEYQKNKKEKDDVGEGEQ